MIKVAKFGGSSLANATQFRKVKKILQADSSRRFVVCSACGKEGKEDHKVTDLLYLCQAHIKYGVSYEPLLEMIEEKYLRIVKELKLDIDISKEFEKIRTLLKKGTDTDYLVSRGEYLTGLCLAQYLGMDFADASEVIAFRYDGYIDLERTAHQLEPFCKSKKGVVIPGFYGAMPNGAIKVMSRGGSDITGAVIANVVNADVYENWTDVSGFLVADPNIVKKPLGIKRITYGELREMSYMGARVLHDDAIFPVKSKNIPINIRNTNVPNDPGTMIVEDCQKEDLKDPPHFITGITGKKDFTVITIIKNHISSEIGFLRKALEIFEKYRISIETVPVSVDSFSIVVDTKSIDSCLYDIVGTIKEELHPDQVKIQDHLSLVAVVGRGMKERPGISGKIFAEFGRNGINIRTINQGSDELSIVVGVENRDFENAIRCIYRKFILEEKKK